MLSVVVVLSTTICAMMPMLRTLFRSVSTSFCATEVSLFRLLGCCCRHARRRVGGDVRRGGRFRFGSSPAIVREGPVRLGHLVSVLAPLDGGAQAIARVQNLVRQPLDHRLLAA